MKKLTLLWGGLLVLFTTAFFISCADDDIDADVEVTSVSLSSSTLTLKVGSTSTLTATVLPQNATDATVTWNSSNTSVATVTNGTVSAVGAGTATITAFAGSCSATCTVTVSEDSTDDSSTDTGDQTFTATEDASLSQAVNVVYSSEGAAVTYASDVASYLTITGTGAHVTIVQSSSLASEITYTLSGTSSSGSFYMDGELKATLALNNLDLTCADSAAVNIENGKRINFELTGTSTLKDSSSSSGKGALMVNGHSEFTGSGTLYLYGYAKHAYWADEYIQFKKSFTGGLYVLSAAKDGINVNQHLELNGGTVNISGTQDDGIQVGADDEEETGYVLIQGGTLEITTTAAANKSLKADGDITINADKSTPVINITNTATGTWDSDDAEVKGAACMSSDGNITIEAGTITLKATGNGGKGMKCDGILTVNGGDINVSTSGKAYVNIGGSKEYDGTYSGNFDQLDDAYSTKAKAIRAGTEADGSTEASGGVIINGGNLTITTTGQQDGSEGLESKNTLYINDGTLTIHTYDDAINSAGNLYIKGGTISAISVNNDAIDSNQNLYIEGGTILALGAGGAESGLDAAEGYSIFLNGGTLLASGGRADSPSSSSSQAWISTNGTLSAGSTVSLKNGSTTLAQFSIPSGYSSSSSSSMGGPGGGGSSAGALLLTAPGLSSGSSYTLTLGNSSTSVTATKSGSSSSTGGPGGGGRW